jgi:heat shock protein 4
LKRHDLEILPHLNCASKELFEQWYNEEGAMHASDRLVIDTAEKRNALEEYVYNTRSKLEMAWSEYVIETDSTKFSKALTEMEDWLYGEGEDATKSVFVEKLSQLKVIGDPIEFRYSQSEERIHAEKAFKDYASSVIVRAQSGVYPYNKGRIVSPH